MDQGPLVRDQIESGARFLSELDKGLLVQTACWVKEGEDLMWYLYISSPTIHDSNIDVGYKEVSRAAAQLQDPDFDRFKVKLIGVDHRIAKAVLEKLNDYPSDKPQRFGPVMFAGRFAEEVYIYPLPISVATS